MAPDLKSLGQALPAVALSAAYLFLHQPAQLRVQSIRAELGGPSFSRVFLALGIAFIAATVIAAFIATRRRGHSRPSISESARGVRADIDTRTKTRRLEIAVWVTILLLIAAAYWLLVAVESELAHLPQYLLLFGAFLLCCRSPGVAAVGTGLVGLADEAFQYWYLQANWNIYLDWNDVVLNLLAASLGCALVLSMSNWQPPRPARLRRAAPSLLLVGVLYAGVTAAVATGFLGVYRTSSPEAAIYLSRSDAPAQFWTFAEWSRKDFHILSPSEGLAVSFALFVALAAIDAFVTRADS